MTISKFVYIHEPRVVGRRREIVDQASQQVRFGQVEQRVEHVDAGFVELEKFIRIQFVHLRTNKIKTNNTR